MAPKYRRLGLVALAGVANSLVFDLIYVTLLYSSSGAERWDNALIYTLINVPLYFGFGALFWGFVLFKDRSFKNLGWHYVLCGASMIPVAYVTGIIIEGMFAGGGQAGLDGSAQLSVLMRSLFSYIKLLAMMAANIYISIRLIKALEIAPGQRLNPPIPT